MRTVDGSLPKLDAYGLILTWTVAR